MQKNEARMAKEIFSRGRRDDAGTISVPRIDRRKHGIFAPGDVGDTLFFFLRERENKKIENRAYREYGTAHPASPASPASSRNFFSWRIAR